MLYGNFIDDLAARLKFQDPSNADNRLVLGRRINETYKEVTRAHDWEYLKRTGEIITIPNYTSGSVTYTTNSRTITGSGTAWDSSFVNRYFKPGNSANWYHIVAVSSQTLTLETPIIEASASSAAYVIWKRFYYLNTDARKLLDMLTWFGSGSLVQRSNQSLQDDSNDISSPGAPSSVTVYGVNPLESTYSTGSCSLTSGSNIMTGTSSGWLGNVVPGDIVTVGVNEYRVKRVESDTQIILVQYAITDVAAGATYTIQKEAQIGVQFYYNPDQTYVIPYTYVKRVYSMINETMDRPELPEEFDQSILDGAEASMLRGGNDQRWLTKFQEYTGRVKDLASKQQYLNKARTRIFAPLIPGRGGY